MRLRMTPRRHQGCKRQGPRSRQAWPSLESGGVTENDGGSWHLFFRILEKLERSPLAVRAGHAAFQSHPRFNRACIRRALVSLSTTAMMYLQRGGMNPADRPLSSMAWSRALRAVDSASCISPLSFDGDKRGRMRQFYEAVPFGQKFLRSDVSLRLLADPRIVPYHGPSSSLSSMASPASPLVADHIRMP